METEGKREGCGYWWERGVDWAIGFTRFVGNEQDMGTAVDGVQSDLDLGYS